MFGLWEALKNLQRSRHNMQALVSIWTFVKKFWAAKKCDCVRLVQNSLNWQQFVGRIAHFQKVIL